ncbi:MAG: hypothetical protein DYG90_04715, partial [Chloroflexi bacterium CFX6]|nr:hypothetical protein [Chloroflexi bacterium CFX6]
EAQLARERAEEARIQALLDAAGEVVSDAIIVVDPRLRIRWATGAARAWFGLDLAQPQTVMTAVRSIEIRDAVASAAHGQPESQTVRIRDRIYRLGLVKLDDGDTVIALRDDTELERLARARRDLVANVSHDLRTPLTSIGLLADALLTARFDDASRRTAVVAQIRDQLQTLQTLADDMVALNQIESGRALLKLQPEPLADLVRSVADRMAPQIEAAGVRLAIAIPDDLLVLVDRMHIVRVLTNLMDNALRFSPPGGQVAVGVEPADEPDRVAVSVSDEGPGIAPGDLERVFERFYRADRARTHRNAGLGLAIARHIVGGHGGRIWAANNPGRGATFRFTVPVATSDPGRRAPP